MDRVKIEISTGGIFRRNRRLELENLVEKSSQLNYVSSRAKAPLVKMDGNRPVPSRLFRSAATAEGVWKKLGDAEENYGKDQRPL